MDLSATDRVGKLASIERGTNTLLVLFFSWDLLTQRKGLPFALNDSPELSIEWGKNDWVINGISLL